jgi:hypothetical protein
MSNGLLPLQKIQISMNDHHQEERMDIDGFMKELERQYQEQPDPENQMLNEPPAAYGNKNKYERPTPDYVLEDFRIGMEQYRRGEYIEMEEFIKSLDDRCLD